MRSGLPVVLATGNPGKVREFDRLLGPAFSLRAMPGGVVLPPETGRTFAENARLKAQCVFEALGATTAVLADDSGLEVAALGGRPGVLSARFAGEGATDEDNVRRLLTELDATTDRSARFVCALCLVLPVLEVGAGVAEPGRTIEVWGALQGAITSTRRGTLGFGYDPVFRPDGCEQTLAEVPPECKDRISHRGVAARALVEEMMRAGFLTDTSGGRHGP